MGEVLAAAAHFPEAFIRLVPDIRKVQQKLTLHAPTRLVAAEAALSGLVERVHNLTEYIDLELPMRCITDTHRLRIFVPRQPWHLPLGQTPLATHSIHNLDLARAAGGPPAPPPPPPLGFVLTDATHPTATGKA